MGLQKSLGTPTLKASRRSPSSPASGKASLSKDKEKEEGLKTELLEHKMPFLEKEVTAKKDELDRARQGVMGLEAENRGLRFEVEALRVKIREMEEAGRLKEGKMSGMEAEIEELRRTVAAQQRELCRFRSAAEEVDECSSSQRVHGLVNAAATSFLLDNFRKSPISSNIASINEVLKPYPEGTNGEQREIERIHPPRSEKEAISNRLPRVPKPPPLPSTASHHCPSSPETDATTPRKRNSAPNLAALPPIPPPSKFYPAAAEIGMTVPPPPPPPPPPTSGKNARLGTTLVRRVPELVEFYHLLMRRDSKKDSGAPVSDTPAVNTRSMIGEIENRSSHLLAIKTDVETQGDFIRFLIKEVKSAAYSSIDDLVSFVKWLDEELSFLVDERAVLKHFDWPEAKADAMREAAFGYCDLRKLELEVMSFRDDRSQPCSSSLKKTHSLLEKLEHGVYNLSRVRDGAMEKYNNFQIPCDWMLDSGVISQIKLASVKLAMKYMKRVTCEIEAIASGTEEEDLMLQGVRFAFRVHQFAGGFDAETMRAFQELKDKARKLQAHKQKQQRSSTGPLYLTAC